MHKRHRAQRQHVILSLDTLLYQLHTLSFILSPSILSFISRLISQFQCSKPRELDTTSSRSLRFFFSNVLLFNAPSLWYHAMQGAAEGRTVVLDFVGLAYVPSRIQLLTLDFLIIFLQLVLTTIAYETSLFHTSTDANTQDMLLPIPSSPTPSTTASPMSTSRSSSPVPGVISTHTKSRPPHHTSPYIIDLRLASILARLRNPPPPPRTSTPDTSLPLPNTTPWPLPTSMGLLTRARAQIRRGTGGSGDADQGGRGTTLPGGLDTREE